MRYLVTGGAGFIGSNLAENLVKEGKKIVVVDNLSTGSLKNLSSVKNKIKFIKAPVMKVLELNGLRGLTGIYHLGIPSTTALYRDDRSLVGESIKEFSKILDLAKRENCRLVYASSSSIYNGNQVPFKEEMPILIKDFYTEARYLMERLAKLYNDFYQVKSIGFRFFSVYGKKEEAKKNFANLVSQYLWSIRTKKPPIIYGNGNQKRDFIFVGDVIDCFKKGMNSNIGCDIFNLGTGRQYSLNELAAILNKILGTNIKPKYVKNPLKNYVFKTLADTKKAEKKLGFKAKTSLEEGIKIISAIP